MRLTIAYSKIKKRNLVLINNDTYTKEKPYQSDPFDKPYSLWATVAPHAPPGDFRRQPFS